MEKKKDQIIIMIIFLLMINISEYISSFLPNGINQLNYFIYLDRMKQYSVQNFFKECSLSMGPNCFFSENKRINNYIKENGEFDNDNYDLDFNLNEISDYQKQWMNFYDKSRKTDFFIKYTEINEYLSKYKDNLLSRNDSEQIPPSLNLRLGLTFESYDDITIKGDTYAYPSKPVKFNTEYIYIEIIGKLRLHYGEDLNLQNQMRFPSKTFGIIESPNLKIRLGGKIFICEFFFLRLRNENIRKINIEGYLKNRKIFTVQKALNESAKNNWVKLPLQNKEIDTLVIPGGIDVDNFRFIIATNEQYYITVQFHANDKQRIKNLVEDNDI